ncbi:hypothetical protein Ptr902_00300 [Pyrenophora tritici-repentis]|nr:hypothetical protein L13192_00294 [Pyrenophora tritici-repentis]KAI2486167.1 hypothetical protein Ptr902_00300 [Pyrenophora tritici-repentis]
MLFIEAGDQAEERSSQDDRIQPWRAWWPPTVQGFTTQEAAEKMSTKEPWMKWLFNEQKPFEKPWLKWALPKPSHYNSLSDVPEVKHEPDFIKQQTGALSPDEVSPFNPIRTNTYLQFFEQGSEHSAEKPYVCKVPPPTSRQAQINFGGSYKKVMMTDVRGHEDIFELDKHGFQFAAQKLNVHGSALDLESYTRQMSVWLKEYLHAREVVVFDRTLRTAEKVKSNDFVDIARRVHCDQSPRSAVGRIKLHMGDRAERLLRDRCRIVNVWRPLVPVVENSPLAMCRFDSVSSTDFIPIDVVFPHYAEESYEIRHASTQRWYYRSALTQDDLVLLKIYDNKENVAYCTPHSSFYDPLGSPSGAERSSVELRCLVFGEGSAPVVASL